VAGSKQRSTRTLAWTALSVSPFMDAEKSSSVNVEI
jgi:hypothetical protein